MQERKNLRAVPVTSWHVAGSQRCQKIGCKQLCNAVHAVRDPAAHNWKPVQRNLSSLAIPIRKKVMRTASVKINDIRIRKTPRTMEKTEGILGNTTLRNQNRSDNDSNNAETHPWPFFKVRRAAAIVIRNVRQLRSHQQVLFEEPVNSKGKVPWYSFKIGQVGHQTCIYIYMYVIHGCIYVHTLTGIPLTLFLWMNCTNIKEPKTQKG